MYLSMYLLLETLTNPSSTIEEELQKGAIQITHGGVDTEKPF